jgi:hypothetical protein
VARIIAKYGCRQRGVGEISENLLSQATKAKSAELNVQSTQYKPQTANRPATASETKYVDRGDIDRRLPYEPFGKKTLSSQHFWLPKADDGQGRQRVRFRSLAASTSAKGCNRPMLLKNSPGKRLLFGGFD